MAGARYAEATAAAVKVQQVARGYLARMYARRLRRQRHRAAMHERWTALVLSLHLRQFLRDAQVRTAWSCAGAHHPCDHLDSHLQPRTPVPSHTPTLSSHTLTLAHPNPRTPLPSHTLLPLAGGACRVAQAPASSDAAGSHSSPAAMASTSHHAAGTAPDRCQQGTAPCGGA